MSPRYDLAVGQAAASSNDLLRTARERTASPQTPGETLSRQELAEQANQWIFAHEERVTDLDGNYIGKLERGIIRWPQATYRKALRAVLGAAQDCDLGFYRPRRTGSTADTVNRQQFLRAAAAVVSGSVALPPGPIAATPTDVRVPDLLGPLRQAVTEPPTWPDRHDPTLAAIDTMRSRAYYIHRLYQEANYGAAAKLVSPVVRAADALICDPPPSTSLRSVHEIRSTAYLAAAKLAAKLGDYDLAWLTADRACQSAMTAETPALAAMAYRQVAGVCHETHRPADAERIALTAAEWLTKVSHPDDPDAVSACGSLYLLAAVTTATRTDRTETRHELEIARRQAERIGADDNRLWSAFGPTNVAIHALSIALTFDDPRDAVAIGGRIDTGKLPAPLISRRAQVHVDIAEGYSRLGDHSAATMHVLEIERIAPQLLQLNQQTRNTIVATLRRARGSTVPILRGVAERAGLAA
jgi:hypothetical protein